MNYTPQSLWWSNTTRHLKWLGSFNGFTPLSWNVFLQVHILVSVLGVCSSGCMVYLSCIGEPVMQRHTYLTRKVCCIRHITAIITHCHGNYIYLYILFYFFTYMGKRLFLAVTRLFTYLISFMYESTYYNRSCLLKYKLLSRLEFLD